MKPRSILLLAVVFLSTSCGIQSCGEVWFATPRTDFYLQGDDQLSFNSVAEADESHREILTSCLSGLSMYMGLYLDGGPSSQEKYKITEGRVNGFSRWLSGSGLTLPIDGDLPGNSVRGSYFTEGDTLHFDLIPVVADGTWTDWTDLALTGECSHDDAQRAIREVRSPKWGNNTSRRVIEVQWTFTGEYYGEEFLITCSQIYRGKSRFYTRNI